MRYILKTLRILSLIFLFIAIAHAGNLAFWYFFMERELSEIPLYKQYLSLISTFIYFSLNLIRDLMIKYKAKNEVSPDN